MSVCPSVRLSVRPHGTTRLPLDRFPWNLILEYFWKYVVKFNFSLKSDKTNDYFTWRPIYISDHNSLSFSQNERYFKQICRENQNTQVMFSKVFFFENRAVYEIIWKNIVQPERMQMSKWRIACWIGRDTNTHSGCVKLFVFFFHFNNSCTNAPQCYVILHYLSCLFKLYLWFKFQNRYAHMHSSFICIYIYIYIYIIPWSNVLSDSLTGHQLIKIFSAIYVIRMFTAEITSSRHLSLSWATSIVQSVPPHSTSWRSILIQSSNICLRISSRLLPSVLPIKTLYTPLLSSTRATSRAHLILLDWEIFGEKNIIKFFVT